MCSPMVIPVVATAAVSAGMAISKSQAAKKVAEENAKLAEQSRNRALQEGAVKASQVGMQMRQAQSTALALAGGSGTDTTAGTAGNMIASSALAGAADIEQVRANAAMAAWGFETEQTDWFRRSDVASREGMYGVGGAALSAIGGTASALTPGK